MQSPCSDVCGVVVLRPKDSMETDVSWVGLIPRGAVDGSFVGVVERRANCAKSELAGMDIVVQAA